jgi:hypothetical protein
MIASTVPRSACTSARAGSEVIHRLVPSAAADRPSSVAANFHVTYGRPRRTAVSQAMLPRSAACLRTPVTTSTPADRNAAAPPAAAGVGSSTAITTRRTPAATSASAHGPVRPVWLHGSSVTTAVPPRARSPARASATISACGPPAYAWKPSPTSSPAALSSTQPTTGLGLVVPRPPAASAIARHIASSSVTIVVPPRRGGGTRQRGGGEPRVRQTPTRPGTPRRARPIPRCLPSGLSGRSSIGQPSAPESHRVHRPPKFDVRVAGLPSPQRGITAGSEFHRVPPARGGSVPW